MHSSLRFRPITDDDLEFLQRLYASTRADEMAVVPWSDEEKRVFLDQQFHAQHTFYHQQFRDARFSLILQDEQPIGRLYLQHRKDEFRIIDISLMPEARGKGFGGGILQDILDEAQQHQLPVRIHVEYNNPAMHLYERLGFVKTDETGVYYLMERKPDA